MTNTKLKSILTGGIAIVALSGCEQLEQAANSVVDEARQTAVEAIDEARQAGSVEEAKQSADNALDDVRQQAAGLLQQASDFLAGEKPAQVEVPRETSTEATPETQTEG